MAKLLHHGITSNDSRITEVTITIEDDTDLSIDSSGCMRTRSQRGNIEYRLKEISILVKIFKLLIYDLSNCLEASMAFADDEDDTDGEVKNIGVILLLMYHSDFVLFLHFYIRALMECGKTVELTFRVSWMEKTS